MLYSLLSPDILCGDQHRRRLYYSMDNGTIYEQWTLNNEKWTLCYILFSYLTYWHIVWRPASEKTLLQHTTIDNIRTMEINNGQWTMYNAQWKIDVMSYSLLLPDIPTYCVETSIGEDFTIEWTMDNEEYMNNGQWTMNNEQ